MSVRVIVTGGTFEKQYDALFNLGYALAMAQSLPPGVHAAMNARTFPWDNVRKNREQGVFEALD